MMTMEDKYIEELRKKLENGDISQELFDEISRRWQGKKEEDSESSSETGSKSPEKQGTTSVSGSGHFSSVTAEYFRISGSGHVSGKVDVDNMSVSGSGKVGDDIKVSNILETSGSLKADRLVEAGTIESSGSLHAGSIKAGTIESSGSLKIADGIEAKKIDISGSCTAESVTGDELDCSGVIKSEKVKGGQIRISGGIHSETVECENFEMSMEGGSFRSRITKLIAGTVKITSRKRFFKSSLEIEELVCREAHLEFVKAQSVKADEVVVGDGCEIDYVEAKVIKTSGDSVIKEKKIV